MSLPKNISNERFNSILSTKNVPSKLRSRGVLSFDHGGQRSTRLRKATARQAPNVEFRMGKVDRPLHSLPAVAGAILNSTRLRRHYFDIELAAGRVRPLADKGLRAPPLSHCRDHLELDRDRRGQRGDFNRRAGRIGFAGSGEMLGVKAIVDRQILFHVREEDRNIDNVAPARARVFDYEANVFEHRTTLFFNVVADDFAG